MSKTKAVKLEEASRDELYEYATKVMALDLPNTANTQTIIARMRAASFSGDAIEVQVEETAPPATNDNNVPVDRIDPATGDKVAAIPAGANEPKVEIYIGKTEKPGGSLPVQVIVNGQSYLINRNVKVPVPYSVYHALEHAVEVKHSQSDLGDPDSRTEVAVPSYPVKVMGPLPSDEEVRAWQDRVALLEKQEVAA